MNYAAHPHELRLKAREATYPNLLAERQALTEIDSEVFAKVREYEALIVAASAEYLAEQKVHVDSAYEVAKMLDVEVRRPLESGSSSTETVNRYEELRRLGERVKAALRAADDNAEYHEKRTADPYGAMCETWDRWPILRPHLGTSR